MIKVFCDKCDRQIYENVYNIDVFVKNINEERLVENINNNISGTLSNKQYCKKCASQLIDSFEDV